MNSDSISPAPWDSSVFGMDCFEIHELGGKTLAYTEENPGHYSIKVDPLTDKSLLQRYGFYYTDTLVEPECERNNLISHQHPDCSIATNVALKELLPMCDKSFLHGRFHRDFNLPNALADKRYKQWLTQLYETGEVYGLCYRHQLAGFIAHDHGQLLLHAISEDFRGQGLAKYFWSTVCQHLFDDGLSRISSSISAANLPVLNLYASLGFKFKRAVDVYHKLTR